MNDESTLNYRVMTHRSGEEVALQVRREHGAASIVHVRIEAPPGNLAADGVRINGRNPLDGATVTDLSPAVAEQLGLDAFTAKSGVLVTKVGPGIAANVGVQPGDIILGIDGRPIGSVQALRAVLGVATGPGWRLTVQRGAQVFDRVFRL